MKDKLNQNNLMSLEILKETMRAWVTGVAIVTGHHNGFVHGMTANSFNSIALAPPTVMVALQKHTRTQNLVKEEGFFGVTILETSQITLARRFAGQIEPDKPRFDGVETFTMVSGAPLVTGGIGFLDCKVVHAFDVGATTVFIGEVLEAQKSDHSQDPLLYFNREWRKLAG